MTVGGSATAIYTEPGCSNKEPSSFSLHILDSVKALYKNTLSWLGNSESQSSGNFACMIRDPVGTSYAVLLTEFGKCIV